MPKHHYFKVHFDDKVKISNSRKSIVLRVTKRRERQGSADALARRKRPAVIEEFVNNKRVSVTEVK